MNRNIQGVGDLFEIKDGDIQLSIFKHVDRFA